MKKNGKSQQITKKIDTDLSLFLARLSYNPETGNMSWVKSLGGHVKAGATAGSCRSDGYVMIRVYGRLYYSHRVAWLLHTGDWPKGDLDHIDGCRSNNRFKNLREVTKRTNNQNRAIHRNGRLCGPYLYNKKWVAQIMVDRKNYYLGRYNTEAEAATIYQQVVNSDDIMKEVERVRSTLPNRKRQL